MKRFCLSILCIVILFIACKTKEDIQPEGIPEYLYLDAELPVDPDIKMGILENGLTYYIKENSKPESRAELRLVVNAGSILEDDDQKGLAHFLEHMAFNGTEHFEKQAIIDYLESIGMRFGAELNAYTTFDETVYRLTVPTKDPENLKTALLILEDWAFNMTLDPEEIEKEKGVVIEEWRGDRGANRRIRDKQLSVIYGDSKYAERLPIGDMEIISNLELETIEKFYSDWYRPDLMAIVVVGDFDSAVMEEMIINNFSRYEIQEDLREREVFDVPDNKEILMSVVSDKEATESRIKLLIKHDYMPSVTVSDYREMIVRILYHQILNDRLEELSRQPDAPFINAYSGLGSLSQTKDFYTIQAEVIDNGILDGLKAILIEAEKVKQFGFTESELERKKEKILSWMERAYNEIDQRESDKLASECIRNFLESESMPGLEFEYEIYKTYLSGITLDEVNELSNKWITEENKLVLASMPEKEGIIIPEVTQLLAVFDEVAVMELTAYVDDVLDTPLLKELPVAGSVISEKVREVVGLTEWILSNGVRVVLKPTDFKNDEVLFNAYSPGGLSLVADSDYISAVAATSLITESGLGEFDLTQLEKKLSGLIVDVSPWIKELFEGLKGSATQEDLETMFKLIYLYFTEPVLNEEAVITYKNQQENLLINKEANPENVFWDTVKYILSDEDIRSKPLTIEILDEIDSEFAYNFYKERFRDSSDFTFIFVGNFEIREIKPFIETYIGGLPSTGRIESWRDLGVDPPASVVEESIYKGLEQKSEVVITFNGDFNWSLKNVISLKILTEILEMSLTDKIREDLGGTYSINVYGVPKRLPDGEYYIYIIFGCAPDEVDNLSEAIFNIVTGLKESGSEASYFNSVKEIILAERETNLQSNDFWVSVIQTYYKYEENPELILEYTNISESITMQDIQDAAKFYFNEDRYVRVVLYPER